MLGLQSELVFPFLFSVPFLVSLTFRKARDSFQHLSLLGSLISVVAVSLLAIVVEHSLARDIDDCWSMPIASSLDHILNDSHSLELDGIANAVDIVICSFHSALPFCLDRFHVVILNPDTQIWMIGRLHFYPFVWPLYHSDLEVDVMGERRSFAPPMANQHSDQHFFD